MEWTSGFTNFREGHAIEGNGTPGAKRARQRATSDCAALAAPSLGSAGEKSSYPGVSRRTRTTANGCRAASGAHQYDSMSTATAPTAAASRALVVAGDDLRRGDDRCRDDAEASRSEQSPPPRARRRARSTAPRLVSCTDVATTTSPGVIPATRPPPTPSTTSGRPSARPRARRGRAPRSTAPGPCRSARRSPLRRAARDRRGPRAPSGHEEQRRGSQLRRSRVVADAASARAPIPGRRAGRGGS